MGTEAIFNYLKNSKIEDKKLKQICYYFAKDYTASQTAQQLSISRQTINHYYKIIRNLLFLKKERRTTFSNCFSVKYIKSSVSVSYYIESNEKVFIVDSSSELLPNISRFLDSNLKECLVKNKKVNCARVIFNKKDQRYTIAGLLKTSNLMQEFIDKRLKKFRGLNKENLLLHLKESQFRFNHSQEYLYRTLLRLLNLNTKTSTF